MKKSIKIIAFIVILIITLCYARGVLATSSIQMKLTEYSDEYKNYLNLSEEEKQNVLEPKRYDAIVNTTNAQQLKSIPNVLKSANLLRNSLDPTYNLQDYIPDNVTVKNQGTTNSCWTFASLGPVETNLALQDFIAGRPSVTYDFSERHMAYASRSNAFNAGQTNEYGISQPLNTGGNFFLAQTYLSNGMGAINEDEMPFEDNENTIDISQIQNKNVNTTLYDTIWFEDIDDIGKDELMSKMKQIISTYGGLYAGVHGASITSDAYNNETGAIYCSDEQTYPSDHAVTIIGWDDNYSVDNFNENSRPQNNGAWIVKNSWGEEMSNSLAELKQILYDTYTQEMNELGYDSAEAIEDEFVETLFKQIYGDSKVSIDGENLVVKVGNNGYMYVSYEDANVYNNLFGVEKVTNTKDYDNIYQHDELGSLLSVTLSSSDDVYIANKFNRNDTSQNEVLDKISLFTIQEITCRVYVNPNSDDLTQVQNVELKDGDSIVLEPGYHMIELKNPIRLTGDSFAIAVSLNSGTSEQNVMVESTSYDENVEVNPNESFYTVAGAFEAGQWFDWTEQENVDARGNVSIKAFTQNSEDVAELDKIEITKAPDKVSYLEGENFEPTGMQVLATYSDLSTKEVTDYEVVDGENLYFGQTEVTISYTENGITKTVEQAITVERANTEKEVASIEITALPTKTTYALNETEINLEGGVIRVTYTDGTTSDINMESTDVTISGFDASSTGTKEITVTYAGFSDTFEIEVVNEVEPQLSNMDNIEALMKDVKIYLYDKLNEEDYIDMKIEVSNIAERNENNNYSYYYYLAPTDSEENIEEWTQISNPGLQESDGTYMIEFNVNTKDLSQISNYEELMNSDVAYLYIREVAEANGETLEQIKVIRLDADVNSVQIYLDNELQGSIDDVTDGNDDFEDPGNNQGGEVVDNTVAGGIIPQAGVVSIGLAITVLLIIGILLYIKYKRIDK